MATMNISLPQQMKDWIEAQVATGRYANASDVVRDALRDRFSAQQAEADLLALIDEGLESGISDKSLDDIWSEAISRAEKTARPRTE